MEVINPCFSMFSNCEVLETLRNIKDAKMKYGLRNLATITYETLQYLEDSPCKDQSREALHVFMSEIKELNYGINSFECLTMANDPPTTALHIQLLIEDSEARFTADQVEEILEIVGRHFPPPTGDAN